MDDDFYSKLCRLCLNETNEEPISLASQTVKDEFYEALSDVKLDENSSLSQMICQNCMNLIRKIGDFKRNIRKNQMFLLNLVQKVENNEVATQFVEVNVNCMSDTEANAAVKLESDSEKRRSKRHLRQNLSEFLKQEEIVSDYSDSNYVPSGEDDDVSSEKDSLSECDFARSDEETKHKSDKLPLPPLEYEKDTKMVWCPLCYIKFKHKYFLSNHGKLRHPEYNWAFRKPRSTRTRWQCKFCDKVYSRRFRLKEHAMVVHFGKDPFQCDICGFTASLKNGIRGHIEIKHLKKHHDRPKETIICRICNHLSATKDMYNNHMRLHQACEERPFNCAKCNLFFKKQKTLDKHNRHMHIVEDFPFSCHLCISARFRTEEILNLHKQRHEYDEAKVTKQPFACSACELRFCKREMLDKHAKHHEKNELDSCQRCGVTLHRSSVSDHMKKHETTYEEYKNVCHLCGKRFRVEYSLQKHLKTHDSPEFFECDKCGKKIKKKWHFTNHVKKCQGLQTEFPCRYCELKFPTKSAMYKHEDRAHKGWSCKRCNMRFDRFQELKVHRRTLEHKKTGKWGKLVAAGILHDSYDLTIEKIVK